MFDTLPFTIDFCLDIAWSKVYRNWDAHASDAARDVSAFLHSCYSAGIHPHQVNVFGTGCVMYFGSWTQMSEASEALGHVLDLLWLID